jgi:hypothetical protein
MVEAYKMLCGRRKATADLLLPESDKFDFIREIDATPKARLSWGMSYWPKV